MREAKRDTNNSSQAKERNAMDSEKNNAKG
jgi:hypothetical protein